MVDLINLDVETIYQKLIKAELPKPLVEVIIEIHETQRATQQLLNELIDQQRKMFDALKVVNLGFGKYAERLKHIEKKFGDPNKDIVNSEKFDG